jgi:hypothetical protein
MQIRTFPGEDLILPFWELLLRVPALAESRVLLHTVVINTAAPLDAIDTFTSTFVPGPRTTLCARLCAYKKNASSTLS